MLNRIQNYISSLPSSLQSFGRSLSQVEKTTKFVAVAVFSALVLVYAWARLRNRFKILDKKDFGVQIKGIFDRNQCLLRGEVQLSDGTVIQNCSQRAEKQGENSYKGCFDANLSGFGTMLDSKQNKYEGEFRNGKLNGRGIIDSFRGTKIEGIFKNNKPEKGRYIHSDGTIIEDCQHTERQNDHLIVAGFFDKDRNGFGYMGDNKRNLEIIGEFKSGVLEGIGEVCYGQAIKETGRFKGARLEGIGKIDYLTLKLSIQGKFHEGGLIAGDISSTVSDLKINNCKEIDIQKDNISIKGVFTANIENRYYSGVGTIETPTALYFGLFLEGKFVLGHITFKNGIEVDGDMNESLTITFTDKTKAENCVIRSGIETIAEHDANVKGLFDVNFNGIGRIDFTDGSCHVGEFKAGKLHGCGELHLNGSDAVQKGRFENGLFVQPAKDVLTDPGVPFEIPYEIPFVE